VETSRLLQVLAVLERRAELSFANYDVLVSVAGGVRIAEPAVDLPLAIALASALRDTPVALDAASFGEVGLTGHVRAVPQASARVAEATRLGFASVIGAAPGGSGGCDGLTQVGAVADALKMTLG
jgi:DNA repair protein RadA/Sms